MAWQAMHACVYQDGYSYWGGAWVVTLKDRLDSNKAEMAAITRALRIAHKQQDHYAKLRELTFSYDSLTAGNAAIGLWHSTAKEQIQRVNRALVQARPG